MWQARSSCLALMLFLVVVPFADSQTPARATQDRAGAGEAQVLAMMQQAAKGERVRIMIDAPRLKTATFSPGVKVGKLLFVSGQVSIDPDGNIVGRGDFAAQCAQVFENIKLVLDKAGASFSDVVKINAYMTDLRNYPVYAQTRGQYFKGNYPASTVVGTTGLVYEGLMLEVEAIAVLK
jgi:2-iminobutanoate/2-iminopropanoate deaminase